ncbi:TolC family protein [Edwardsiella hoshinae]|uniref:Type I secretion outer membrane protein, TolC family n=1 Tax=Edwardsiella hoshinae TaxID=93378 RepID=A0A376DCR3_9GAMM|nr:TolC family protein [Edwardsiella hoshinae]QPR27644.1 TolC family protein [Edwardsiella hoshinae]STC86577.1 type I secretion outer membrane protein, TolC family [Edwardsiella hoshinae]
MIRHWLCFLLLSFTSIPCFALADNYQDYLHTVIENTESVKAKEALVDAEELNQLSAQLYAIPKLSAYAQPKSTRAKRSSNYVESKITLSALLFDDATFNSLRAQHYKLLATLVDLDREKERITVAIMSDQINITLYEQLRENALKLKYESEALYQRINVKYEFGIIKESDVKLAKLLVQKINNEIDNIDRVIDRLKLNIESNALYPYPAEGVEISRVKIERLLTFTSKDKNLIQNFDLKKIALNKYESKENAAAQDSLYSITLLAENKYANSNLVKDDSYIGVKVSLNLFNLDNKLAQAAGMATYRSLSFDYDHRYKWLKNQVRLARLTTEANTREITNLEQQLATTQELVKNQEREYSINQVSVYEMLNTRFDLFQLDKSIADIKVSEARNKIGLLQLYGQVLDFFY